MERRSGTILAIWWDGRAILIGLTGVIAAPRQPRSSMSARIQSLTYSAPFVAPLAYTRPGISAGDEPHGRLAVERSGRQWVLLFTLGGFVGNFVLTLSDHAANGFFYRTGVGGGGGERACGWFSGDAVTDCRCHAGSSSLCAGVLVAGMRSGGWGFLLHAERNLHGPSIHVLTNLVWGGP